MILYNKNGDKVYFTNSLKMSYIPKMFTRLVENRISGDAQHLNPLDGMDCYRLGLLCSQQDYKYKVLMELKSGFVKKLSGVDRSRIVVIQNAEKELLGYILTIEMMEELLDEVIFDEYPYQVTEV